MRGCEVVFDCLYVNIISKLMIAETIFCLIILAYNFADII